MFSFQVLKRLVVDECLFSWNQTICLQIVRVRLGFEVMYSPVLCSCLRNVSSPGAGLVFLPVAGVLRIDECLGSWSQFSSFVFHISAPCANPIGFVRP